MCGGSCTNEEPTAECGDLQDIALALLPLHGWLEGRDDSFVKDILQLQVASSCTMSACHSVS